ncbi:MAG: beta-glucosidase [Bacteroidetes bacterium]|nr:MAG: beta-glucosidase [Bacteroidota bacterium]
MDLLKRDFGPDFKWGVSSSAYQIEGAWDEGGKGKSIWDVFSNTNGRIFQNQHGNITSDFYNRYPNDLALMSRMKIPNYRFSLAWSRIMPSGTKTVNPNGIAFYHRVIDACLTLGIEPWITLYHWDLPWELEKKGGWTNRDIIGWFSEYAAICIKHFGDKVKYWMILNEPMVFTGTGYFLGVHAPGRRGLSSFLASVHHAAMCQAEGGRIFRSMLPGAYVGTTFSCSLIHPRNNSEQDASAAFRVDTLLNRLFVEPLAGLGYPVRDLKLLNRLEPYIKDGDESKLAFPMDFIGVQNYTREIIARSLITPLIWAKVIRAGNRNVETTDMNWEIYPESIYHMLKRFSSYDCFKEIIVTENGAAFSDFVDNGRIHDERRKNYIEQYLQQVLKARNSGVNVNGYFVWSFTDNFEWAEGYKPRFGLVYIDYATQERIIKDSGFWYSQFLQND